jgi:Na+/alanine symporter
MAWFNIIAIILCKDRLLAALKDYEKQKKKEKIPSGKILC